MTDNDEWITGTVGISLHGEQIEMQMTVPAKPVKLRRMLPIFQMMTNSFVQYGVELAEQKGEKVSCGVGCAACCRQPVPLSEAEAFQIAELVENMPEPQRGAVKARFDEAARHFRELGWFEQMDNFAALTPDERQELVLKYFREKVDCPFLVNEGCSIHPDRPLSCREYLMTSPPENCWRPTPDSISPVEPPLKLSRTLRHVGVSGNMTRLNFVPLVRSLEWAAAHRENALEKTGQEWMAEFFGLLSNRELPAAGAGEANL